MRLGSPEPEEVGDVGRIDLLVDAPSGAEIELKFESSETKRCVTSTASLGSMSTMPGRSSCCALAFLRYLTRRAELHWTATSGACLVLPEGLPTTCRLLLEH